jgi:formyltetrahydrofolate hydrolase
VTSISWPRRYVPFFHLPLMNASAEQKAAQEARVFEVVREQNIDLVVLAATCRCCPTTCAASSGRDQHPPFVPAELQGRQAVLPGA